jgi:hypothetical protein
MNKRARTDLAHLLMDTLHLGLEGWEIHVHKSRQLRSAAACTWEPGRKFAIIEIWPSAQLMVDLGPHHEFLEYATAFTLLHELLHIRLEGHLTEEDAAASQTRCPAFEWALDMVATALLRGLLSNPTFAGRIPKG